MSGSTPDASLYAAYDYSNDSPAAATTSSTSGFLPPFGASWLDALQPASWRGIPFAVFDSSANRGRRVGMHEYPFRDTVWPEDLGRAPRRYAIHGFLVGDDCYDQEQAMLDAAEVAGPGELVHPSLGSISVSLLEFSSGQRREAGRVVELQFGFVEYSAQLFPTGATSTQDAVNSAADDLDAASSGDFWNDVGNGLQTAASDVQSVLQIGSSVVAQAAATVQGFGGLATGVMFDASRVANAVNGLGGIVGANYSLGRYAGGNLLQLPSVVTGAIAGITSTVGRVGAATGALLSAATSAGTAVQAAAATAVQLAGQL